MPRLYAAISTQEKNFYKIFFKSMTNLIWQLQNKNIYSVAKIKMPRNNIAQATPIFKEGRKNSLF
jgi:hypothetical protein